MRRPFARVSRGLAFGLSVSAAFCSIAGEIIQTNEFSATNPWFFTMGQTFTAEDAQISTIGFYVHGTRIPGYPPANITYNLLQGAGANGPLLASATLTLPADYNNFADANFSSVTFTVGQVYSVLISVATGDFLIGEDQFAYSDGSGPINHRTDPYTGGEAITAQGLAPYMDLTFRIEPVPEPTAAAFTAAMALAYWLRRRHRMHERPQHN